MSPPFVQFVLASGWALLEPHAAGMHDVLHAGAAYRRDFPAAGRLVSFPLWRASA